MEIKLTKEVAKKLGLDTAKTHFEFNMIPMLENAYDNGITEFRVAMQNKNKFIIHPFNKDGETIDIDWTPSSQLCFEFKEINNYCKGAKCTIEDCQVCKNEMY